MMDGQLILSHSLFLLRFKLGSLKCNGSEDDAGDDKWEEWRTSVLDNQTALLVVNVDQY